MVISGCYSKKVALIDVKTMLLIYTLENEKTGNE